MSGVYRFNPQYVIDNYKCGDEHDWKIELEWLWTNHSEQLLELMKSAFKDGIKEPVDIRIDEQKVWDGHHRIAVAMALGIDIPIRYV